MSATRRPIALRRLRIAAHRLFSRRLSVADVFETAMWLSIPYTIIGLGWAFFHAEEVRRVEGLLSWLPAGGEMAAYLVVAEFWPVSLLLPPLCLA